MKLSKWMEAMSRKKTLASAVSFETKLKKCLTTFDLVSLGIGCTLSSGIYVIIGEVIKNYTGPAVFLSFLIAALASALAAFSYSEFGSRVPRAGSAYMYCYVAMGEIWGYLVGWNLILEYVIGSASTAKSVSSYLDSLTNHTISNYLTKTIPFNIPTLSPYPDLISFAFILLLTMIVCFGVNESVMMNNVFVLINASILLLVVVAGATQADVENWEIPPRKVPDPSLNGVGGFFPFGFAGIIKGASICFYSYIGFDVITIAGEESKDAAKSVPIAIGVSLVFCTVTYLCISCIITLMVPYYALDAGTPISSAFRLLGWTITSYFIDSGAILCLSSSLLSYMIAMPRIFYSMACDGLLFRFLAIVNPRFKTPVYATLVSGSFTAILALCLSLIDLVNMMSIGTLLAYTLVSFCVLWLRYQADDGTNNEESEEENRSEVRRIVEKIEDNSEKKKENKEEEKATKMYRFKNRLKEVHEVFKKPPSKRSEHVFLVMVSTIVLMTCLSTILSSYFGHQIFQRKWWALLLFIPSNVLILVCFVVVCCLPRHNPDLVFKVPLVPYLPLFSIMVNIYLMGNLSWITWVRFVVWMFLGFIIYFSYGIHSSSANAEGFKKDEYTDLDVHEKSGGDGEKEKEDIK